MKNTLILVAIMWAISLSGAYAQVKSTPPSTERMQAMKVAFITDKIKLTTQQSQSFWPIYNEYQTEQKSIQLALKPPKGMNQMSDQDLENFILNKLDNEAKLVDLKRTYMKRFQEVISIRQIVRLEMAEREFNREVVERLLDIRKRRGRN